MLEKTAAPRKSSRNCFGVRIAELVAAVSDPPGIEDYEAQKAALRRQVAQADSDAQAIYAADKVAKAREVRAQAARLHVSLTDPALQRRLAHYEKSLETLLAVLPDAALVRQLEFELWALRQLPPPRDRADAARLGRPRALGRPRG